MPVVMGQLDQTFATEADSAVSLAKSAEDFFIRSLGSYKPIHHTRIEYLYELAYLRLFVSWEVFLEAAFLRYLCGHISSKYGAATMAGVPYYKNRKAAETAMLGGQDYVLWGSTKRALGIVKSHILNGRHEIVIAGSRGFLQNCAFIRNRVAHGQPDAIQKFNSAAMSLCGRSNFGTRPGRLLRAFDTTVIPNLRWIESLARKLKGLASAIV